MPDPSAMTGAAKTCAACGRTITWRKKWADCWEEVRFCSAACRKNKPSATDHELESAILALLEQRAKAASICPSEAARSFFGETQWREQMERTRRAARRLVDQGKIEILQKGRVVDPSTAKGPIRLRRKEAALCDGPLTQLEK
jgi:hypothetical protein